MQAYEPGAVVEYYSASVQNWIPARVLRRGAVPGTYDLDCKEGVDTSRIRGGGAVASSAATLPPTAVPPRTAPGGGPLPVQAGDPCFYKSSSLGWISAQILKFRPEDKTYDLDVKQQVPPSSIFCIEDGCQVEYHSTSTDKWIPARVLRRSKDSNSWDLDCKEAVHISRIRPPQDYSPPASPSGGGGGYCASPAAMPPPSSAMQGGRQIAPGSLGAAPVAGKGGGRGGKGYTPGGLAPLPESGNLAGDVNLGPLQRQQKLEQLSAAVNAQDAQAIKGRLESVSALHLVGAPQLDEAAHNLWALEARPAARADLQQAMAKGNRDFLEAALEAATAVGLPPAELDAAREVLCRLSQVTLWRYDAGDGHHMDLRKEARVDGPRVRSKLECGDLFCVSEERRGPDGILYLQLADGRGWSFDHKPGIGALCHRAEGQDEDGPGQYVVIHDKTPISVSEAEATSAIIGKLAVKAVVNVVQVVPLRDVVRGRVDNPAGWITLVERRTGLRMAARHKPKQKAFAGLW